MKEGNCKGSSRALACAPWRQAAPGRRPLLVLATLLGTVAWLSPMTTRAQGVFIRGDCDGNVKYDLTDAIVTLSYLFLGGRTPECLDACDPNDSGLLDITDPIYTLGYLFLGGPAPAHPFPLDGVDETADVLTCANGRVPPVSLRAVPPRIVFHSLGETLGLRIFAEDEEGDILDVTLDPGIVYSPGNAAVATIDREGIVTSVAVGAAVARARYRATILEVPIVVAASASGAPTLRITAPPDGALVTSQSVTLTGVVSDPAAQVFVGESPVASSNGFFRAEVSLPLGVTTLGARAVGARGEATATVRVTRVAPGSPGATGPDGKPLPSLGEAPTSPPDTRAPGMAITSPTAGATLLSGSVTVEGTVDEPDAIVFVNGQPASVEAGFFSARLRVSPGSVTLRAEAIDAVGNRGEAQANVTIDATRPEVTITTPGSASTLVVGAASATLQGTVAPSNTPVTVNGLPAQVAGGAWNVTLPLADGVNDVVATASLPGALPRRAQATRAVIVDREPPVLELISPPPAALASAQGYRTTLASIKVVGTVFDPGVPRDTGGAVAVLVNGSQAAVSADAFVVSVPLVMGANALSIFASDARGNSTSQSFSVTRVSASSSRLSLLAGDGAVVVAGAATPLALRVASLDALGGAERGVPITFEVRHGDGAFPGGQRIATVLTGIDGSASALLSVGKSAGLAGVVVTASAPGRLDAPLGLVVTTSFASSRVLVAHGQRTVPGVSGALLSDPIEARLLDGFGNAISGAQVSFRVTSGGATLGGGGVSANVATGASGVAGITVRLPAGGDSRSVLEVTHPGAQTLEVVLEGRAAGPAADTRLRGVVWDAQGQPVAGARVSVQSASPPLETSSGPTGVFELAGAPSGAALLAAEHVVLGKASARARVLPGRLNLLDAPLVLPFSSAGELSNARARTEEIAPGRRALVTLPALSGVRLEIAVDSVTFPDGSRTGRLTLLAPHLLALPAPGPDDTSPEAPLAILPSGVRFDPPAKLSFAGVGASAPGRRLPVFQHVASSGGWLELPGAKVDVHGVGADLPEPLGVREGGVYFAALPGPPGGVTSSVSGQVVLVAPEISEAPQREASEVLGWNVYAHSGELFVEETDLELPAPGRGLHYAFRRRYESRHAFRGSLGWGWEHEYEDRRLYPTPLGGNIIRATGRGRFDEYLLDAGRDVFVSPIGVFSKLFVDPESFLIERDRDGTRWRYHPLDGSPLSGRLESVADRTGTRLSFLRDPATGGIATAKDPFGRTVSYVHRPDGSIASITDFTGRTVTFEQDVAGDLVAVTGPPVSGIELNNFPAGKRREYRYRGGSGDGRLLHNLVQILDPREVASAGAPLPRVVIAYGEDPALPGFDRVMSQTLGGTNASGVPAGGAVTFGYEVWSPPVPATTPSPEVAAALLAAAGRTTCADSDGTETAVTWSGAGLPLSVRITAREGLDGLRRRDPTRLHPPPGVAPAFYETRHEWTREGLLRRTTLPRGDRWDRVYDESAPLRYGQAALVRLEHHPAPQSVAGEGISASEAPAWTYAVDPLFALEIEETPPRGNATPAPERSFTTRRRLDYEEGSPLELLALEAGVAPQDLAAALSRVGIQLEVGDLNGDGITDQRFGNVVRETPPAATLPDGTESATFATFAYNAFGQRVQAKDASGRATRWEFHPQTDADGDGTPAGEPGLDPTTGGFPARRIVDLGSSGENQGSLVERAWRYDPRGYLTSVRDGRGLDQTIDRNSLGQPLEARLAPPFRYRRQFFYDADDNISRFRDENLTSPESGGHFVVPENRWLETALEHDLLGRLVSRTDEVSEGEAGPARSITTAYRYDLWGRLTRVVRPVPGTDEALVRDERGLVIRRIVGAGTSDEAATDTLRDENGEVVLEVDADDSDGDGQREATERRFDGLGRLAAVKDAAGGTRFFERDLDGSVLVESFMGSPGGPLAPGETPAGVLLSRTCLDLDERGQVIRERRWRFSDNSQPATELLTRLFRDGAGRVVRRIGPDGGEWRFVYDGAGRLEKETDPGGAIRVFLREPGGQVIRERREALTPEPVGAPGGFDPDYDEEGRYRERTTIVRGYDLLGRLTVLVDPAGGAWRARYDSRNNLVFVSDTVGTSVAAANDPDLAAVEGLLDARQLSNLNGQGNRRRYAYDNLGRLVKAVLELRREGDGSTTIDETNTFNADGLITESYEWDDDSRLTAWTNDTGGRTQVLRDAGGHILEKRWPGGATETYELDLDGNPHRKVDPNGSIIEQDFDALHRVVERRILRAEGVEGTTLQRFEHDGLSRLTLAYDDNQPDDPGDDAVALFGYDSLGDRTFEAQDSFAFHAERDASGHITALEYPGGLRAVTPRSSLGAMASLGDGSRLFATYRYLGSGRLLEKRLAGGLTLSFLKSDPGGILRPGAYDGAGAILEQIYRSSDGEIAHGFEYGRDRRGYKLYETTLHRPEKLGDVWRLDSAARIALYLPDVFEPRVPPADPLQKLAIFADGNHSWRFLQVDFSIRRVDVDARSAYVKSGSEVYTYDPAGNLRAARDLAFTYDALGRLVRLQRGGRVVSEHRHDAFGCDDPWSFQGRGRRVAKNVLLPGRDQPAGVLRYLYWGDAPLEERDETGRLLREHLQEDGGPTGSRPAALITHTRSPRPETWLLLHDAGGSVTGLLGASGQVFETYSYGPYGDPALLNSFGSPIHFPQLGSTLQFAGLPFDHEVGFISSGGRLFDPMLGRFLTEASPLAPAAPFGLNGYQHPGLPAVNDEVAGHPSPQRAAPELAPFGVPLEPWTRPSPPAAEPGFPPAFLQDR